MTRAYFMTALLGFAFACCAMPAARSDQLGIALIISIDEYGSQPGPKRCSASATAVRDTLRSKGFKIIERDNLDRGEFDSAVGALARRAAASPAPLAVLYYCGYALEFDGQSFLLPNSATIARDNDVLTQGIVAKNVVDSLGAAPQSRGFVLLDVFRTPNAAPTGLGRLIEQVISSNFAVIGTSNDGPGEGPTAASLALRDQFTESEVDLDAFVVRMSRQLSRDSAVAAHFVPAIGPRPGPRASPLPAIADKPAPVPTASIAPQPAPVPAASIAAQPAAAPAASIAVLPAPMPAASIAVLPAPMPAASIAVLPAPMPAASIAAQPALAPATSTAAHVQPAPAPAAIATSITAAVPSPAIAAASTAAPVPPAPASPQPAANASSRAPPPASIVVQPPTLDRKDKRLIQTILTQIGYYAGQIDGKFGPETQAAIRRYQLESNADATGRLTTEQVIKLLCVGCLPPPAPRDDAAYCAALSALYRRYLDNAGEGRFAEVAGSVAMDECARGNPAVGIPILEKKLLDGRFTAPAAAR